eukprot:5265-Heterococcus_DN1.PRE.24
MSFLRLLGALLFMDMTYGHSWISCTDIAVTNPKAPPMGPAETDPVRRQYDDSKCNGYPRGWAKFATPVFGTDQGSDYISQPGKLCREKRGDYTDRYPMATYVAGSTVCAQYPSKTHVAAATTNIYIPDTSLKIYRTKTAGAEPTSLADMVELKNYNGVHVKGVIDYLGFQRCPSFDSNNDKSVCTVCFDVGDVPAGEYTYVWSWIFNENNPPYTTCWEATVAASEGSAPPKPASPPVSNLPSAPAATPVAQQPQPYSNTGPQPSAPQMCKCPCASVDSDKTAPAKASANADTCVTSWQQCAGKGFRGSSECCSSNDTCTEINSWYGQCKPSTRRATFEHTSQAQCDCPCNASASSDTCVTSWQQCAGKNFSGGTQCCSVKDKCVVINSYYSQCQPQS